MKTTIKYRILAILFFVSFASLSQFTQIGTNQILQQTTVKSFNKQSKGIVGTSYINDNFLPAKHMNSVETYLMRYNAYKDVFEVQRDGAVFYFLPNLCYHKAGIPEVGQKRTQMMLQLNPSKKWRCSTNLYKKQYLLEPKFPILNFNDNHKLI